MKRLRILLIIVVAIFSIIMYFVISSSYSRYQTNSVGEINSNIAFYLAKTGYMTQQIKLSDLSPSNIPYVFTFSVSNRDGNKVSDVDLSYVVKIVTTTNIPLRYELYMNEDYSDEDAVNLIDQNNTDVTADSDGTYFQTFTMDSESLYYSTPTVNNYTLLVYYDESVGNAKYQDTIDSVRINIDSRQIIE